MMRPRCNGFQISSPTTLPDEWREWLASQTLVQVTEDEAAFFLVCRDLPERTPDELGETTLELLAWSLVVQPQVQAVVAPLYSDLDPSRPRHLTTCNGSALDRIMRTGHLTLVAARSLQEEAALLALHGQNRESVLVRSRAMIESRVVERPTPCVRVAGRWTQLLTKYLRQRLSVRQKIWIKRQLMRVRRMSRTHPDPVRDPGEPILARCKEWLPAIDRPQIALRQIAPGGRIPILLAVHWLELGGAEKFVVDLARALPKDRFAVHIITEVPSENPWAATLHGHAEAIVHLPEYLPDHAAGIFYEHYIRTRGIRLMHIHHGPRAYESLFHIRRFHPHIKIFDTLHILELPPHPGGYPEYMARNFAVFLDCHHVISRHLGDFLTRRWLIPPHRVRVIHLNVDVIAMDPEPTERGVFRGTVGLQDTALVVGFVGRFTPQKRPLAFLDMARRLLDRWRKAGHSSPLHFFMAGSGPLWPSVHKRIAADAALAGHVHLVGELDDVRPFYRDCDLVAMPSENEGLALVAYEAMAMGLPLVFTDVGAQSELLPSECLVPPDGAVDEALAQTVWPLLLDDERRREQGMRNRNYVVEHHPAERTFSQVLDLYEELLVEGASGRRAVRSS